MPSPAESSRRRLVVIDGSGFVYRAYHALPRLTTRSGFPTGAVFGFLNMLNKVLKDFEFDAVTVAFDTAAPTFRHDIYAEYKQSRPPMPPELARQWPYIKKICEALGVPSLELEGFEADDVIAGLAEAAVQQGYDVLVVTSDKDLFQLASDHIRVYHPLRDRTYDPETFRREYGFPPGRIRDFLALVGDKIDDIPGVRGIGEKTARELVSKYGSLEEIYNHLEEIPTRFRKKLEQGREQAWLSRRLVRLEPPSDLAVDLKDLQRRPPRLGDLVNILKELEFYRNLEQYLADIHEIGPRYERMADDSAWSAFMDRARRTGRVAVACVFEGDHPVRADLVGVALAVEKGHAWVLPAASAPASEPAAGLLDRWRDLRNQDRLTFLFYDAKTVLEVLRWDPLLPPDRFEDILLMAYVLDPGRSSLELERLAAEHLLYRMINPADALGKARSWRAVAPPVLVDFLGERADLTLQLAERFMTETDLSRDTPIRRLYDTLEKPLVPVLVRMERAGIQVDVRKLKNLAGRISRDVQTVRQAIFDRVGFEFNLNSSQQLAKVLFEHLQLQPTKKTKKTRRYSTRQEVLEELARVHDVPRLILEYRARAKIKSTFVDALLHFADPRTHRVHTRFNQAVTATGRLSSSDPNLQNIPIRDELGDALRDSFVAPPGRRLVSADYSQIEMRILAHLSEDPGLLEAFRAGWDIHTKTAAEVLGKTPDDVTPRDRRLAKAVNYGIAYGLSAYGLSQQTGMDVHEAQAFIDRYFEKYPRVRAWLEATLRRARETGFVESMFGRRRYIPEINSAEYPVRQAAERQAVNMPVQATAADIMKKAMIDIDRWLREEGLRARIVLQVHDELVLETPEDELAAVMEGVRVRMEQAGDLHVPLEVDIHAGPTWLQAKQD